MDPELLKAGFKAVGGVEGISKGAKAIGGLFSRKKKDTPPGDTPTFSPALEKLISLALEDGDISDQEIQMLVRKAEKEGVDPDEFRFIISKRLKISNKNKEAARQAETAQKAKQSKKHRNDHDDDDDDDKGGEEGLMDMIGDFLD